MSEDKAKNDALTDIRAENDQDSDLEECYFGSALVTNAVESKRELINILIPKCASYEEAVGIAYLDIQQNYPPTSDFFLKLMTIERETIFANLNKFKDETEVDAESV